VNEAQRHANEAQRHVNEAQRHVNEAQRHVNEAQRHVNEAQRHVNEVQSRANEAKDPRWKRESMSKGPTSELWSLTEVIYREIAQTIGRSALESEPEGRRISVEQPSHYVEIVSNSSPSQKAGVFRSKPSEPGGESRGAYFLYASTLDAGIAKGSAERRRPSQASVSLPRAPRGIHRAT
jgi:hypothetical protein